MGGFIDSIFGDNKGPSAQEQNEQAAAQSQADRDYEAKLFAERDEASRLRAEQGQADEMERLRLKEKGLRQRESEETLQGLGLAGMSDITLGDDDVKEVEALSDNYRALDKTLNAGTGLLI